MVDQILFENKTTVNKAIFIDGVRLWIKTFKLLTMSLYFIAFVSIVSALLCLLTQLYFLSFTFAILIVFVIFYPKLVTSIIIKRQQHTFRLERTYSVYNDRLEIKVAQNKTVIPFYMIKVASENKNNFYMIYENQIICISKKGFTVGGANKFSSFIKSKVKFK